MTLAQFPEFEFFDQNLRIGVNFYFKEIQETKPILPTIAPEELLVSQVLNEHQYCDTSRLRFNRSSGKYLPRTAKQEEQILESLKYAPIDLEDLKYFREELEAKHPKIKWTPHPITKFNKKVFIPKNGMVLTKIYLG